MKIKTFPTTATDQEINEFLEDNLDAKIIQTDPLRVSYHEAVSGVATCPEAKNGFIMIGAGHELIMDAWSQRNMCSDSPYDGHCSGTYSKVLGLTYASFKAEGKVFEIKAFQMSEEERKWMVTCNICECDYVTYLRDFCEKALGKIYTPVKGLVVPEWSRRRYRDAEIAILNETGDYPRYNEAYGYDPDELVAWCEKYPVGYDVWVYNRQSNS